MRFPVNVRLCDSGMVQRVNTPDDLPQGVALKILGPSFYEEAKAAYQAVKGDDESLIRMIEGWMESANQRDYDCARNHKIFAEAFRILTDQGSVTQCVPHSRLIELIKQLKQEYTRRGLALEAVLQHANDPLIKNHFARVNAMSEAARAGLL